MKNNVFALDMLKELGRPLVAIDQRRRDTIAMVEVNWVSSGARVIFPKLAKCSTLEVLFLKIHSGLTADVKEFGHLHSNQRDLRQHAARVMSEYNIIGYHLTYSETAGGTLVGEVIF